MDNGAFEALVAVLQADHALHMSRCRLLCGETECDWSLRELLAALCWEVTQNLSLGSITKTLNTDTKKKKHQANVCLLWIILIVIVQQQTKY